MIEYPNQISAKFMRRAGKCERIFVQTTAVFCLVILCAIFVSILSGNSLAAIPAAGSALLLRSLRVRTMLIMFLRGWSIGKSLLLAGALAAVWLAVMQPKPFSDFALYSQAAAAGNFSSPWLWFESKAPAMTAVYGALGTLTQLQSPLFQAVLSLSLWFLSIFFILKALRTVSAANEIVSVVGIALAINPNNVAFSSVVASEWLALAAIAGMVWLCAKLLVRRSVTIADVVLTAVALNLVFFTRSFWILALVPYGLLMLGLGLRDRRQIVLILLLAILAAGPALAFKFSTGGLSSQNNAGWVFLFGTNRITEGGYSQNDIEMLRVRHPTASSSELNRQAVALAWQRIGTPHEFAGFFFDKKLPKLFGSYSRWSCAEEPNHFQEILGKVFTRFSPIYLLILLTAGVVAIALVARCASKSPDFSSPPTPHLAQLLHLGVLWMWGAILVIAPHVLVEVQGRYSLLFVFLMTAAVACLLGSTIQRPRRTSNPSEQLGEPFY
jgi:hypothetical protein